jgi:hypothetical protein
VTQQPTNRQQPTTHLAAALSAARDAGFFGVGVGVGFGVR